jgi:maltose-binding protein MalE
MKNRLMWIFVAVVVLSAVALLLARKKTAPHPEVAIQDGKAIDFSSGKPVIKDSAKEQAAIAKAVKEMEEAAQGVTFSASQPQPTSQKKAEPKK